MATTFVEYTGDGNATKQFTFPSYQESDVKVRVDGVLKTTSTHYNITNYTTTGGGNVVFTSGNIPSSPAKIRIYRDTSVDAAKATYTAGSSVKAADLNNNNTQLLYRAQEEQVPNLIQSYDVDASAIQTSNIKNDSITSDKIADDQINSEHYVAGSIDHEHLANDIIDGDNIQDDVINSEHYVAGSIDHEHLANDIIDGDNIQDDVINSEHYVAGSIDHEHLANDIIDGDNIQDDVINSEHYAAGSIDTEHIANENITTAKLANDAVTSAKLADNAVVTANIVDGNVTHVKLANNAVDGDNIADDSINSEHYVDGSIDTAHIADSQITTAKIAADAITNAKIADNSIDSEHYVDGSIDTAHIGNAQITTAKIADGAITDAKIAGGSLDNRYYTETELDAGQLDNRYYTEAESDARYFNISTGDTIKDGDTFPDNDTTIATTAAINDRIIDLVDDVGGFVPIANETSFPTANPDVNNGSGTLVSIKAIASTRTPSSGTVTIANGAGSGNTVTITGCGSTVLTAGFGVIVETTTTLHTYAFHRLVPKATEVTTVAGISSNITTVANNTSNINAVAADASDIGTVAGAITNVNNVGGSISNVNTVASNISNVNTVANNDSNITAVAGNSSNINSAVSNASNINSAVSNASNINSAVSNATNINLVAGSISNVNTTAGSIANVNTTASNIANVNNFAATYQIASSAPSTDGAGNALAAGDLYFDTTANELRVHNGSTFQGGVTATGNLAGLGANTFTGAQTLQGTNPKIVFTDTDHNPDFSIQVNSGGFAVYDETNSSNRLQVNSDGHVDVTGNLDVGSGLDVTGNITVSGNVDGRDVAADGSKLDGISTGATRDLLQDVSPQLGGHLDVNGKKINTAISNGNIQLEPNGTGVVEILGDGSSSDGTLQLNCSQNSHGIKLKSPAHSAGQSYTLTFPTSLTNNGVLTTNSSGTLSAGLLATANIADGAVTAAKIATNTITADKIATNAVNTGEIVDGSITAAKIATNVITADKIASGAVNTGELADDAVTTAKIADDAVTAAKLANTSVTAGSYGSSTAIPAITVDAQGRITAASTNTVNTTTNLGANAGSSTILITSSTGTNVTLPEATSSNAGVMSTAHHDKLDGIEASATADQTNSEIASALSDQRPSMKGATLTDDGTASPVLHIKADNGDPWGLIIGNDSYSTGMHGLRVYVNNNGDIDSRVSGNSEYRTWNIKQDDGSTVRNLVTLSSSGSVELRHQGNFKLGTTSTGVSVTGNIAVSGTVDGVDVAALSSTVSGITSNATHSGEVTGATALTIADNVVDEANLKVSNSPVNGYMLTAQSGNTGGLTWAPAAAGATGASNDEIFWENGTNVTADYTITNGKNAGSFGPITIDSGVTVTVGAGETWTVV